MKNTDGIKYYSPIEETINISSHAVGVILSIIALVLLIIRAETYRGLLPVVCFSIFGVSLIILYSASTLYHSAKKLEFRIKLKVFDHAAIYVLIAGTYTPLTLITIQGTIGWTIFIVSWVFAMIGITLKLFFTGRYSLISTLMYV